MKVSLLLSYLLISIVVAAGDKPEYAYGKIPPAYLVHADAVLRFCEQTVDIKDLKNVINKNHYVVTILNKKGEEYSRCYERFSRLEKITSIYGNVYDKDGKLQYKIKEADFKAYSMTSEPGYYEDDKAMMYKASFREYPYTVEFFTEVNQFHSFYYPECNVRPDENLSVEHTDYIVSASTGGGIRYKAVNTLTEPKIIRDGSKTVYSWNFRNIPAERKEQMTREDFNGSPVILVAPIEFRLGEYTGTMKSWHSMGSFLYELNKDRDQLNPEVKGKVHQLTTGLKDPFEKISVLYKFMQEHTRYVSIQYGIGGWQTLEARFVSDNQYGDCKALSNYMLAMLKEVGIVSYPVIVYAGAKGYYEMPDDFAVNIFNHEILCVPVGGDTVWLECTSRDSPVNYLGSFTSNRKALMLTPQGGVVVRTPIYDKKRNIIRRSARGKCMEDGSVIFFMQNYYSGIPAEPLMRVGHMNEHQRDQFIHSKLKLPSYVVSDYVLSRRDGRSNLVIDESLSVTAKSQVNKSGNYQLLNVDLAPADIHTVAEPATRKKQFYLPVAYSILDTFMIELPPNTTIDLLPVPVNSVSLFGSYKFTVEQQGGKVIAVKQVEMREGLFEPGQYSEYEAWVDNIHSPKHYKVILRNK